MNEKKVKRPENRGKSTSTQVGDLIRTIIDTEVMPAVRPIGDWKEIVGDTTARYSKPVSMENGVLRVHVYDNVWKHHLELNKELIKKKINEKCGREIVRKIRFKVKEIILEDEKALIAQAEERPYKQLRKKQKKAKKYPLSSESKEFVSNIKDPDLRKLARRLLSLFPPE